MFADVYPNPDLALVARVRRCVPRPGLRRVVGVGGGSALDTAKAAGVELAHGGPILDYEYGRTPLTARFPPLVAIPTTARTVAR